MFVLGYALQRILVGLDGGAADRVDHGIDFVSFFQGVQ